MSAKAPQGDSLREIVLGWKKIVVASFRYWHCYLVALVLAGVAAVFAPKILRPVYVSQTVLLHRELIQATSLLGQDAPVETQRQRGTRLRELLLARTNLERILQELSLYPDTVESKGVIEAVTEMLEDTECRAGEDTYSIKFQYHDPELVHAVTERLAESLISETARYRLEQARSTRDFLEAQRERTEKELVEKEQKLAEFIALHPEFAQDVMAQGGQAPAGASIRAQERKAASIDPMIDALERQRARLAKRLRGIDNPGAAPVEEGELDPLTAQQLSSARRELEDAQSQLASVERRYTSAHPDVGAARRRAEAAKAAYDAAKAAASVARSIRLPSRAPVSSEEAKKRLQAELGAVQERINRARKRKASGAPAEEQAGDNWLVDLETEWTSLNRDVYEVRDRFQQLQRRYFQAAIIANVEATGEAAQMVVIDPAYLPERPTKFGPRRVGAAAAALVLVLGAALAVLLGRSDDRLHEEDDLRALALGRLAHAVPLASRRTA